MKNEVSLACKVSTEYFLSPNSSPYQDNDIGNWAGQYSPPSGLKGKLLETSTFMSVCKGNYISKWVMRQNNIRDIKGENS